MLYAPKYNPDDTINDKHNIGLAVESMRRHTTDEGWQIFEGLEKNGYRLYGYNLYNNITNVPVILEKTKAKTIVIQDKREWDVKVGDFREPKARFKNVEILRTMDDIFKVTILKDAHQKNSYHEQSAKEMGVHAWIVYYDVDKVKELAPFVREAHLIRTYHTVDSHKVPKVAQRRKPILLSGAVSPNYYPLRWRLIQEASKEIDLTYLKHPGYHRNGCCTYQYFNILNMYKVAICTSSIFNYALRKIIEATACGCIVVTDLKETMPEIDGNLIRISPEDSTKDILDICRDYASKWSIERQEHYAMKAKEFYDYKYQCKILSDNIEKMRLNYNNTLQGLF